jgi:hypothetical protein
MPTDDSTVNSIKNEPPAKSQEDTGVAAHVVRDVDTGGRDFSGHDKITEETTYNVHGLRNPYLGLRSVTFATSATFARRDKKTEI